MAFVTKILVLASPLWLVLNLMGKLLNLTEVGSVLRRDYGRE